MTDERWVFTQDIREKKQVARSASKTNRQGKGPVKLPSDYMSKKELKKMNGEIMNYNLSQAVNWQNFKFWPKDIQQEYLDKINDTYHATFLDLERVFKTTVTTIRLYFKSRGLVYQSEKVEGPLRIHLRFKIFVRVCSGSKRLRSRNASQIKSRLIFGLA